MADVLKKFLAPRNVKKNGPVLALFIISLCILAYHQYSASSFARLEISSPHLPEWRVSEAVKSGWNNVAAFGDSPGSRALGDARRHHSYHRAKRPIRLGQEGDSAKPKTTAGDIPVVEAAA